MASYEDNLKSLVLRYYKDNNTDATKLIKEVNYKIGVEILENIELIFFNVIYEQLNKYPKTYWNIEFAKNTYNKLMELNNSKQLYLDSDIFQYYVYAKDNYDNVTDIINDLSYVNESVDIKNKMYRLPTYVNISEGVKSNLFRFLVLLINQNSKSDYSNQNTLKQLLNVLMANGFEYIDEYIDVGVRNAINHGLVFFSNQRITNEYEIMKGDYIIFRYREGQLIKEKTFDINEFERLIESNYDAAGGTLLGITLFLNNNFNDLIAGIEFDEFILNEILRMQINVPGIKCRNIFKTKNIKDEIQLNIELDFEYGDIGRIAEKVYNISFLIHNVYRESEVDVYFFGINHIRSNKGWIKLNVNDIEDILYERQKIDVLCKKNISEKNQLIWLASDENIDLREVKYFRFPNYISEELKVLNIKDSSVEGIKRLRGEAYIGEIYNREDVLEKIKYIINWMKDLKNPPDPANKIKYGDMEADVLYVNVYESDTRRSRKDLFSNNDNFVCRLEYTKDIDYRIEYSGIGKVPYNRLYSEEVHLDFDNGYRCLVLWRDKKYRIIEKTKKIGRNEPCPCNSGKKYKKCCLNN